MSAFAMECFMRASVLRLAFIALSSTPCWAAGSPAQLTTDLATLKTAVAKLKSDLNANATASIPTDKSTVQTARSAVIADLNAAQALLAPQRAQIMQARAANEQAQQKFRQDKQAGNTAQLQADMTALITAFQNVTAAQDAYIAAAASNGLPVPTAQQMAARQAAEAVKMDQLQLKSDTIAQNTVAIATDQAKLGNDEVALSNAQAALINSQATGTPDPIIAEAEKLLGTNVGQSGGRPEGGPHTATGAGMGEGHGGNLLSAFGLARR
jgi:hypothetical protein